MPNAGREDKNAVDLIFAAVAQEHVTLLLSPAYFWKDVFAGNEAGIPELISYEPHASENLYNNQMCVSGQVSVLLRLDDTGSF